MSSNPVSPKWFIVRNPAAGRGQVKRSWPKIRRLLQKYQIAFSAVTTRYTGHGIELAQQAVKNGHRYILAIGGDGTLNEVANGILQQEAVPTVDITLGLISIGTGNDWARTHKLSRRLEKRIQAIQKLSTVVQDAGWVQYTRRGRTNKRFFVNAAGMAYDAYVVKQSSTQKRRNTVSYLTQALRGLYDFQPVQAEIIINDQQLSDRYYLINAGIGRYAGGGMRLVPHADPTDGQLAITLAGPLKPANVIKNLRKLYNGKISQHPLVNTYQTTHLRVTAPEDQPVLLEIDGEFIGQTPVEMGILPQSLRVVIG